MKAIETFYKGYKFRSRLEARWAVFFDALGFDWQYEYEGYVLDNGTRYLPDFFFPKETTFLEVKAGKFSQTDREKCRLLSLIKQWDLGKKNSWDEESPYCHVILLDGPPDMKVYEAFDGGEQISDITFIHKDNKYHPFLYGETDWDDRVSIFKGGHFFKGDFTRAKERAGIIKSRSARFEFGENKKLSGI